jgi:hypothetical protein
MAYDYSWYRYLYEINTIYLDKASLTWLKIIQIDEETRHTNP